MDGIRGFLSRFAHLQPIEPVVQKAVCDACVEIFGYTLQPNMVHYQGTIAFIEVSSTFKKALQDKKIEFLACAQKKLPPTITLTDVR